MTVELEHSPLPSRHTVRNLIEDLIGRDVQLSDGLPPESKNSNVVAVYVTDRLAVSAIAVVDFEGAARIGGALAMVPRGGLDDAIKERDFNATLKENCYEVLNVLSAVFNVANAPHVRLYEMYGPGAMIPGDVGALAVSVASRMDVKLEIAGYGAGRLSIIVRP
jgi:hypothetical protein